MDTLIGAKEEIKKLFLVYFIPGTLATWPWVFIIGKWFNDHPLIGSDILKEHGVASYVISLLFFYGSGHMLGKLGTRLEVILEWFLFKFKKVDKKVFYDTWDKYLNTDYDKTKPSLLRRYYTDFITGFKFELNCMCSLPIMLISLYYLERNRFSDFMTESNLYTLMWVSMGIWLYLLFESLNGIIEADRLRNNLK
jgi:hypothetical protein